MLKLIIKQVIDGTNIRVFDDTGLYSAENEGGYGSPNLDRSDLKLYLIVKHFGVEETISVSVQEYDPLSVSSFYINAPLDGYKRYYLIGFDITSNVITDEDARDFIDNVELDNITSGATVNIDGVSYTIYYTKLICNPTPSLDKGYLDVCKTYFSKCNACNSEELEYLRSLRDDLFHAKVVSKNLFRNNAFMSSQKVIEIANKQIQKFYKNYVQ